MCIISIACENLYFCSSFARNELSMNNEKLFLSGITLVSLYGKIVSAIVIAKCRRNQDFLDV